MSIAHVDLTPPLRVAENAGKGLRLRREFNRGGTVIGVACARDLSNRRKLSTETVERMVSYFARHALDKQAKGFGDSKEPSAGYIAWLLWGGDEGCNWANARCRRSPGRTRASGREAQPVASRRRAKLAPPSPLKSPLSGSLP
ncbi:hypothetical protein ACQKLX_05730 [Bosea sp. NPDC003192]|jgi:hypothetical protein|uniref:hypothetical protein n=1 Tax=Bosea sp. NPDC003192 TaxID=3390551 RepID=UPI003CFCD47E